MEPGDLLSHAAEDRGAAAMAPEAKNKVAGAKAFAGSTARLPAAVAAARGLQAAGNGVCVALMSAQANEPEWREAFAWAQSERLPVVFVCADTGEGARRAKDAPAWAAVAKAARSVQMPTITADGEDAVAMFRVMQEAVLRARTAGGPSVVWAVLSPSRAKLKAASSPVARLRQYMAVRGIPVEGKPVH
jgi:pyruvate dehydrogenase E1 component alpha subunit